MYTHVLSSGLDGSAVELRSVCRYNGKVFATPFATRLFTEASARKFASQHDSAKLHNAAHRHTSCKPKRYLIKVIEKSRYSDFVFI